MYKTNFKSFSRCLRTYLLNIFTLLVILTSLQSCKGTDDDGLIKFTKRIFPEHHQDVLLEVVNYSATDEYFEISGKGGKLNITGSSKSAVTSGVNWYIKYVCDSHISWCSKNFLIKDKLPLPSEPIRKDTKYLKRFYMNYCTHSYSMSFWNWERWEKELDWMALHGINMPLSIVGAEAVWQNTLKQLGCSDKEIKDFLCGPAYFAWLHMDNMEKWGGPLPDSWIENRIELQKKILNRMNELGMEPVLQGFFGMVPSSFIKKYPDANINDLGDWNDFIRPAFILPTEPLFKKIAKVWYEESDKLFGKAKYYAADPFHEGGSSRGVDLKKCGQNILACMRENNPDATWVIQSWQNNPRSKMLEGLNSGDIIVLDLYSETRPQWGDKNSLWYRNNGFDAHKWIWNMLQNFGGNVGMYGRINHVANGFYAATKHCNGKDLVGIGATPEGIESNPVLYELLYELPWHDKRVDVADWLKKYTKFRYGTIDSDLNKAWSVLHHTAYDCNVIQEGTTESILCARPALNIKRVSSWGNALMYYDPKKFRKALTHMLRSSGKFKNKDTYLYDLVDVMRQHLANTANTLHHEISNAFAKKDIKRFEKLSDDFLNLILDQDKLLSTRKEYLLGRWLEDAKRCGTTAEEKKLYEWNARTLITVWGNETSARSLHEYSHREWAGLLKSFYYPRWKMFFDSKLKELNGDKVENIDWYKWEEKWTRKQDLFTTVPSGDILKICNEMSQKYN